jgi:hypothetical protein
MMLIFLLFVNNLVIITKQSTLHRGKIHGNQFSEGWSGGAKPESHGSITFGVIWRGKAGKPRQYNFRGGLEGLRPSRCAAGATPIT